MITESQMVLSSHEANARREVAGQPAINSVWFWGEGALPATLAPRYAKVFADDAFARGLARVAGVDTRSLPHAFPAPAPPSSAGETLVVVDGLTRALRRGDVDAWLATARAIDERWLAPASKHGGRSGALRIVLTSESTAVTATLPPKSRWRFMRRARRMGDHA